MSFQNTNRYIFFKSVELLQTKKKKIQYVGLLDVVSVDLCY